MVVLWGVHFESKGGEEYDAKEGLISSEDGAAKLGSTEAPNDGLWGTRAHGAYL